MSVCVAHGEYDGQFCVPCYSIQQERVERESAPLRYANTAQALRRRVLSEISKTNGQAATTTGEAASPDLERSA